MINSSFSSKTESREKFSPLFAFRVFLFCWMKIVKLCGSDGQKGMIIHLNWYDMIQHSDYNGFIIELLFMEFRSVSYMFTYE